MRSYRGQFNFNLDHDRERKTPATPAAFRESHTYAFESNFGRVAAIMAAPRNKRWKMMRDDAEAELPLTEWIVNFGSLNFARDFKRVLLRCSESLDFNHKCTNNIGN